MDVSSEFSSRCPAPAYRPVYQESAEASTVGSRPSRRLKASPQSSIISSLSRTRYCLRYARQDARHAKNSLCMPLFTYIEPLNKPKFEDQVPGKSSSSQYAVSSLSRARLTLVYCLCYARQAKSSQRMLRFLNAIGEEPCILLWIIKQWCYVKGNPLKRLEVCNQPPGSQAHFKWVGTVHVWFLSGVTARHCISPRSLGLSLCLDSFYSVCIVQPQPHSTGTASLEESLCKWTTLRCLFSNKYD